MNSRESNQFDLALTETTGETLSFIRFNWSGINYAVIQAEIQTLVRADRSAVRNSHLISHNNAKCLGKPYICVRILKHISKVLSTCMHVSLFPMKMTFDDLRCTLNGDFYSLYINKDVI